MTLEELKKNRQFVNWVYKTDKNGKKTKVPVSSKGIVTGTSEEYRKDWVTYDEAEAVSKRFHGIGLIFDNGVCGIDIDHKDENDPIVKDVITLMDTYTEISPSGKGYHILFTVDIDRVPTIIDNVGKLKLDPKYYQKNPHNQLECYIDGITNRYFTFTGNVVNNKPLEERTEQLLTFLNKYMVRPQPTSSSNNITTTSKVLKDDEILNIIRKSKQANKFSRLFDNGDIGEYGSNSEADMGLCSIFSWYTQDFNQIDRLFKQSKLYRKKWDRKDYKFSTITKAIEFYSVENTNNNQIKELTYITAEELQNKELPPVVFYIDKLIPQGLNIICSSPKMGKSWLALDLCLSVSRGLPFLGFNTIKSSCLYLALEDSHNRLKDRTEKLLNGKKAPSNFIYVIDSNNVDNGLVDQLDNFLKKFPDIKLIIIDTLQKVRGESKNTNAYAQDYKELSKIKSFADNKGLCIILIHHLKKGNETNDVFDRVSGTNGITGTADTTFVLSKKNRNDTETYLSVVGRDVEYNDYIIKFDKDTCKWEFIGSAEKYNEDMKKQSYYNDTLVETIKTLVNENDGVWAGTMKQLNLIHNDFYGYKYSSNETKLKNEVDNIKEMLMYVDKIEFIPANKNPSSRGRLQTFKKCATKCKGVEA